MGTSGGGVFLPGDPPPSTGQVLTTPTLTTPTLTSPTISGTVAISGTTTIGTGSTITTPTVRYTAAAVTSAGTTGTDALALTAVTPAFISTTGASGAGLAIPTGAGVAGASYDIRNINATGVQNIYAVGGTIDGTTGTTAFALSPTGSKAARLVCVAAGTWYVTGVTTT